MASPTPVLPEVPSTMVDPGLRRPSRSALSTIAAAGRSLTLPPGLRNSSFPIKGQGESRPIRSRRTMGVLPTRSRSESATSIGAPRSVRGTISMPSRSLRSERSSSVCNSVGSPARRRCTATSASAWSDDRHAPCGCAPDVGDQRWRDIGERQRDDVVRAGDQSLGWLVGSDDDEHVHGDMLVHLRGLCLGTGPAQCVGRGRPVRWGGRASASGGPAQCVGRAGPS